MNTPWQQKGILHLETQQDSNNMVESQMHYDKSKKPGTRL